MKPWPCYYYIKAFGASPRPLINDSSKKRTLNSLFVMAHYPPLCPPACPPGRGSTIFIGELLQRTRSLPFNSVCFPERNTSKTAFHRIIIGSSWILTKAQNPFMLEKPRRNFLERSQISLLLLFLSSSLLIFLIFFQVPAIIVSDTGDEQTGGGQWKSVKVQNADSSFFSSFPSPCFDRL